eukprot:COSAG03_NODE_553_length_6971_cov_3.971624_7_plen_85_part_00
MRTTTPSRNTRARPHKTVRLTSVRPSVRPSVRQSVSPSVCLSLTKGLLGAVGAELLEYGPPVCLLGTVLLVILLKELGHLNVKY